MRDCGSAVIASEAKQSRASRVALDCFVDSLLAMTAEAHAVLAALLPIAACAAARRAIGTR
jgi:hypothetical protein